MAKGGYSEPSTDFHSCLTTLQLGLSDRLEFELPGCRTASGGQKCRYFRPYGAAQIDLTLTLLNLWTKTHVCVCVCVCVCVFVCVCDIVHMTFRLPPMTVVHVVMSTSAGQFITPIFHCAHFAYSI